MNENRIKDLAVQAFVFAYEECKKVGRRGGEGDHLWISLAMGKSAELIVKEVCNIVLHYDNVDEGVKVAKQHFGVEK